MGKKGTGGWFSTVKKVFKTNSSKDLPFPEKKENLNKWQHDATEVLSFDHFPTESSADTTNDESNESLCSPVTEDRNHAIAVATAAAAPEAAVAAAQAAAKVV